MKILNSEDLFFIHLYYNSDENIFAEVGEYWKYISNTPKEWWIMYYDYTDQLKPFTRRTADEWWNIFYLLSKYPEQLIKNDLNSFETNNFDKELKKQIKLEYQRYNNSNVWKEKRDRKLVSVDYECEICGEDATQVHHLSYSNTGLEGIKDLQAICKSCHYNEHKVNLKYKTEFSKDTPGYQYELEEADAQKRIKIINKERLNKAKVI